MSLTNLVAGDPDFPNPSGGSLTGTCTIDSEVAEDLADLIVLALAILADPDAFSDEVKNSVGELLDLYANLGSDDD
jgi:hypothetical protein